MKTPEEYKENLKKGTVTDDMIDDMCYSYYIRSLNYNRRENEYITNNYYANPRNKFYKRKNIFTMKLMQILDLYEKNLTDIIKQRIPEQKLVKICDYDEKFDNVNWDDVISTGYYYNVDRRVEFVEVKDKTQKPNYNYYLHYQFPKHDFYIQIDCIDDYENKLEIITAKKPLFKGEEFNNLLCCQFCDKVYKLLFPNSGN